MELTPGGVPTLVLNHFNTYNCHRRATKLRLGSEKVEYVTTDQGSIRLRNLHCCPHGYRYVN